MRCFFLMAIVPSAVCSRYVTLHALFFHRRGGHTVLRGYYTFKLGHCLINQLFRHLLSGQFEFNEWSVTQCFLYTWILSDQRFKSLCEWNICALSGCQGSEWRI